MLSSLLNYLKIALALLAAAVVCFAPLPGRDSTDAPAFLSPKVDDNFSNLPQYEGQTLAILRNVAVRGSGRIGLPRC
ncbi:MAG TPA: hypothetical protein DCZ55_32765 [Cyanobacteria bacterium UBA11371]|nr:hypothetical protein [Cyanobacteria bacterium UBA11371]